MNLRIFILVLVLIFSAGYAQAHEFKGSKKNAMMMEMNKERQKFDACIAKAKSKAKASRAEAEKACRAQYGLSRLMGVDHLLHDYMEHPIEAEDLYTDVYIGVRGKVARVDNADNGYPQIIFSNDGFGMSGVRCEFPKNMANAIKKMKIGKKVTVGGIVKGMVNDSYVRITHCEIIQ